MTTAGYNVAGDNLRIPQDSDVTVTMAITESIDGADPTPVNLTGKTIVLTVQRAVGDHTAPNLTLSSDDASPKLTVLGAPTAGIIQIVFVPTNFPTPLKGTYRVNIKATGETKGKPYGVAEFEVYAT